MAKPGFEGLRSAHEYAAGIEPFTDRQRGVRPPSRYARPPRPAVALRTEVDEASINPNRAEMLYDARRYIDPQHHSIIADVITQILGEDSLICRKETGEDGRLSVPSLPLAQSRGVFARHFLPEPGDQTTQEEAMLAFNLAVKQQTDKANSSRRTIETGIRSFGIFGPRDPRVEGTRYVALELVGEGYEVFKTERFDYVDALNASPSCQSPIKKTGTPPNLAVTCAPDHYSALAVAQTLCDEQALQLIRKGFGVGPQDTVQITCEKLHLQLHEIAPTDQ